MLVWNVICICSSVLKWLGGRFVCSVCILVSLVFLL